jgi:hypothetical protein
MRQWEGRGCHAFEGSEVAWWWSARLWLYRDDLDPPNAGQRHLKQAPPTHPPYLILLIYHPSHPPEWQVPSPPTTLTLTLPTVLKLRRPSADDPRCHPEIPIQAFQGRCSAGGKS